MVWVLFWLVLTLFNRDIQIYIPETTSSPPNPQENGVDFVEPFKHISWRDPSGPRTCLPGLRRSPRRWDIIPWHKISSRCGKPRFEVVKFLQWQLFVVENDMGVSLKIGFSPKWTVYYIGKPQLKMDDLGGPTPIFGNTQIEKHTWGEETQPTFLSFEPIWNLEKNSNTSILVGEESFFWESIVESSWMFHVLGR